VRLLTNQVGSPWLSRSVTCGIDRQIARSLGSGPTAAAGSSAIGPA
jgi:hypothetical protein